MKQLIGNPISTLTVLLSLSVYNLLAQSTTPTVGFVRTTAASGSDTIVAPQVLRPVELSAGVGSVISSGGQATLAISGATLTPNQFQYSAGSQPKTYFAKVTEGALKGSTFAVVSNTASEVVVNLDGLSVTGTDITGIEVRPYWTLNTLFPSSDKGVSFVESVGTLTTQRRTQILLPDTLGGGINRPPNRIFFFNPAVGDWVATTGMGTAAGDTTIGLNEYLILRNTGGTPPALTFTESGGVDLKDSSIYLATSSARSTDNYISVSRPLDYTLAQLGFDDSNFTPSLSLLSTGRKDTLFVINRTGSGVNRSPNAVYFRYNGSWYNAANTASPLDPTAVTIAAGSALIVRKATSDGFDDKVNNNANFVGN